MRTRSGNVPWLLVAVLWAWAIGASAQSVLGNDCLRLTFDDSSGRLTGMRALPSGDEYLTQPEPDEPLLSVTVGGLQGQEQVEARPVSATLAVAADSAVIDIPSFRTAQGEVKIAAQLTVKLRPDSSESRWTLRLSNHEIDKAVWAVTVPRLRGVRLGDRWEDDALLCPYWGGERFPSAVADFADMAEDRIPPLERGNPRIDKRDGRYVRELLYAGGCSMMWMDYTDGKRGLYFASYDPEFLVTALHADTAGPQAGTMALQMTKWVKVPPGQDWTSAEFVVATHSGDWHWAASQYRAWFNTQVPLSFNGGAWRERVGGWLMSMKGQVEGPALKKFSDLPDLYSKVEAAGMDTLIPYGWAQGGFDAFCPWFYPGFAVGGPGEMRRAYRAIIDRGGHIMTYTNGRLFNVLSPEFDSAGESWAAKAPDGANKVEPYGTQKFAVMCPGSEGWQRVMAGLGEMLAGDYKTDLVYYDQIAAAPPVACYSSAHGHAHPGLWNQNYVTFMRNAYEDVTRANPNAVVMVEGCADIYTPYAIFQSYLGLNFAGARFAFPEMYKFTFPEAIQAGIIMFTSNAQELFNVGFQGPPLEVARRWLCHEILVGNFFAFLDPLFEDHPWFEEVQDLIALRKAAGPWIGGVFRDDVDIVSRGEGLEVKAFQREDDGARSLLVGIYNEKKAQGLEVTVDVGGIPEPRAMRLGRDGTKTPVDATSEPGRITFAAPSDVLSMTIIESPVSR